MNKNKKIVICAALLCVVSLVLIISFSLFETAPKVQPENFFMDEFDGALIDYLLLNGYNSSDFIVSPSALKVTLGISASGAQSNTQTELLNAAEYVDLNSFNVWYSHLKNIKPFSVANSVWSNASLLGEFNDEYTKSIKKIYNADAYSYNSDDLTGEINNWFNKKTSGNIPDVADDLSGAVSVLLSTQNLKTAWSNAFKKSASYEGVFVDINGNESTLNFMEQTGEYLYAEENGAKAVVIPLQNNLSFVCFIGGSLNRFEKIKNFHYEKVRVVLPKFELESVFDSRDLLGFLLSRSVFDAIDEKSADFNICRGNTWFIQELIQGTKITVNEKGVGYDETKPDSISAEKEAKDNVKEFAANTPFSFAVFSDFCMDTQQMLYYGQLMNGNKNK